MPLLLVQEGVGGLRSAFTVKAFQEIGLVGVKGMDQMRVKLQYIAIVHLYIVHHNPMDVLFIEDKERVFCDGVYFVVDKKLRALAAGEIDFKRIVKMIIVHEHLIRCMAKREI